MLVCKTCGSESVVCDAWVNINTGEVEVEFEYTHCMDCDNECTVREA